MPVQINATWDENQKADLFLAEQEMLLTGEEYDRERVGQLIEAVTSSADQLEQKFLPGSDAPLSDFQTELEEESDHVD